MLSATYHAQCWAISAAAVVSYHGFVSGLGLRREILDNVLVLAGSDAALQIWDGPYRQPPRLVRLVSTGCLLVSLGAATRHFQVPHVDLERIEWAVHVLLAFTVLGLVEPVRQNRRELQPYFIVSSPRTPHIRPFRLANDLRMMYMDAFIRLVLFSITALVGWGLGVSCMSIWQIILGNVQGN
ncbi:hypothetical protein HRG_002085 [Hirsutella rhossiliensis]|uniref:Uncharacterized protein n=1 Tax=Hirsutella rhossiliensis TaxID=111463 RepID=A0A9P8SL77_9HYPO|nr:uncharacterized protein HRG_02085 [Hirsutella rhossiliensis]KAH0966676.1 hypothetical protein HRG_02085 [Hirsutella rhossiliensis]